MGGEIFRQYIRNNLKSLKRTLCNLRKKWKYRHNVGADTLWVSLGENCLADDILRRHGRKSFSSVFSSGRSNIEYLLQMEHDGYQNLLKKEHLQHFPDGDRSVVRSTFYKHCVGQYSERHMLGFEFSHHDPLRIKEDNRAFKRRVARQLQYRGKKNFVFLYHHRITENSDLRLLRANLNEFLSLYNTAGCNCKIILFYQHIIADCDAKHLACTSYGTGLLEFVCFTHEIWGGDDLDTFWARKDDLLFAEMFDTVDDYNRLGGQSAVAGLQTPGCP
ncbi:putative papain-like cysteine peptidase DUF1796 [Enterobacter sp. BIGb0383]|uniref:DUF1796 family putative cysteine peptidase n=1 Tax=unclassified Enterobacter TaxID=2608935 RepID=UPI000F47E2F9|nr:MULTISPECIES: DUF1796 family putative cysteine peptidase [unclassified Enterobacter]ROP49037.1 putative papain-like cysteine peptidase DUF1796 [Enterobacter sp. BIGb0383]ROS00649.1 putative papain-like cysteine peptidase DUF1796 [Enterobacter sp. BIGb0359]